MTNNKILKTIVAFLWNKFPRVRDRLPIVVQCHQCKKKVHGREAIEKWLVSWHLCKDCAIAYVNGIFMDKNLSPESKTLRLFSPFLFPPEWEQVLNMPTRTFDLDVVLKATVAKDK